MRSADNGSTWKRVAGTLDGNTVSAICKHPSLPGVLFAAQYGSIYLSADDGRSWKPITTRNALPPVKELAVTQAEPGTLLAVSQNQGVYAVVIGPYAAPVTARQ
jgi:photosystem II stability/assembly factor-like uncharacterized protein